MKKAWLKEEEEFLLENYFKMSSYELSQKICKTEKSIFMKAYKLGINKKWTKQEDEILIENYGKKHFDLYKNLLKNRTYSAVLNRASVLSLFVDKKIKQNYKYNVNHNFFSTPNELNSYWAGFIAADGNVKSDCSCLSIKLSIKDIVHLKKFKKDIKSDGLIRVFNQVSFGKTVKCCELSIYSQQIIEDLKKVFNITSKKTFSLMPPYIIKYSYKISYICGIIDGDGSICCVKNKNNKLNYRIVILGNENIILWTKSTISERIAINNNTIGKKKKIYFLQINGKNCINFFNFVSSIKLPLLKRKWIKLK
jgi:hypothetical protein